MATEILMPQLGLTMEEGTVEEWVKHEGDEVKKGDVILKITTDKLSNDIEAEEDGVLLKIVAQEGEDIPVKGVLGYIGQPGEAVPDAAGDAAPAPAEEAPAAAAPAPAAAPAGGRVKISHLAKKIAEANGIDYSGIAGTGTNGRIVKADIEAAIEAAKNAPAPAEAAPAPAAAPETVDGIELQDGDEVKKMSGMMRTIAKRMTQSSQEIPTVTHVMKVDVTDMLAFRKKLNKEYGEKRGIKFSVNDLVMKAVAKALREHPEARVSYAGKNYIQRAHVNIGMAVSTDDGGLITPVVRDADKLTLTELAAQTKDLASRARTGNLNPDEYKGSTFNISNLGMFGVEAFSPIINQPDSGILGICATEDELQMDDEGKIVKRQVMRICYTHDHRVINGAEAVKFEKAIKEILEDPMSILL
ncbi:MAG: dihydrolipoamide acetyltransferase family protein [Eubacteriales bacterium]|nr:dihydrolipoamide acetyltransferase family protein [Eubacteriales bacterium]